MGKKRKHRPKLTGRQSLEKWLEERWLEERKELQAEAEEAAEPERPKVNPFKRRKEGPTLSAPDSKRRDTGSGADSKAPEPRGRSTGARSTGTGSSGTQSSRAQAPGPRPAETRSSGTRSINTPAPTTTRSRRPAREKRPKASRPEIRPLPGDPLEADLIDWLFLRAAGAIQDAGSSEALPEKTLAPPGTPRKTPAPKTLAPRPPPLPQEAPAPSRKTLAPRPAPRPQKTLAPTSDPPNPLDHEDFGRSAARALVSLMLCDGRITTTEKALVDGILRTAGEPPLEAEEIRIWRPGEVPPPPDVEDVLDALAAVAHADGQRDPGEWRLVLAFGRSWGASEDLLAALEERYHRPPKSSFKLLIEALRSYVAQARAELAGRKEDRHG